MIKLKILFLIASSIFSLYSLPSFTTSSGGEDSTTRQRAASKRRIDDVDSAANSERPFKEINVGGQKAFENDKGERFFGSIDDVLVAGETQRDSVWNIIESLILLRAKMGLHEYQAANLIVRGIYTFMTENHQICFESWCRFSKGNSDYVTYSGDSRFHFAPNCDGITFEKRSHAYFTTLAQAYEFALTHDKLLLFFTNAFPRFADGVVDLDAAHQAQKRWLDAQTSED